MRCIDLTGQKFGRLTAAHRGANTKAGKATWVCTCECGGTKTVISGDLKSGRTQSCGCLYKTAAAKKMLDLTDRQFGRLTALRPTPQRSRGKVHWDCICECGQSIAVTADSLTTGHTKSCGCFRRDVTKQRAVLRNTTHGQSGTTAYITYRSNLRRSDKLQRTPPWSDIEKIRQVYANCPEGHHVDHIIPLKGEKVSGFHIAENLQYLTAEENLRKKNKFEPLVQMNSR
jgi:hypothetical protein